MDGDDREPGGQLTELELHGWFTFLNAHTHLTRQLDAALQACHRVSLAEHTVLQRLELGGGQLRMSELAEVVLLSPSGASRLVDRLVGGGLIERLPCGMDGRAVYAAITARGRARLAEAAPTYAEALRRALLDRFSPQEYETLTALLLRVAPACRHARSGES